VIEFTVKELPHRASIQPNDQEILNLKNCWLVGKANVFEKQPYKIGGMCLVHKGVNAYTGRIIIGRYLQKKLVDDPKYIGIIKKEYEVLSQIEHPAIPKMYGIHQQVLTPEVGCSTVMVMEYIEGQSMEERIDQIIPLQPLELTKIISNVGKMVDFLHTNHKLYHGDLKPAQIILSPNGNVRVIDFASSNVVDPRGAAFTPEFAAPERQQLDGVRGILTEVYSLAAITYYALTRDYVTVDGKNAPNLLVKFKKLSKGNLKYNLEEDNIKILNAIFDKALATNPQNRFSNASTFAGVFADIMKNAEGANTSFRHRVIKLTKIFFHS